jgi:iron complex outermembrane receptor protein
MKVQSLNAMKALLCATVGAAALGVAHPVLAEETASSSASPAAAGSKVEEVVVTARRRSERLIDVPAAVTALSADDLQRRQILRLDQLQYTSPSLTIGPAFTGNATPGIGIRGLRNYNIQATQDSTVAVYLNEFVLQRTQGLNAGLYDLESVQVLKGPQGTLFGRNSIGGAILLTTRAPQDKLGGYVDVSVGDYNLRTFEGALNVPISDKLQVRAAGRIVKHDGYTYNLGDGRRYDDENTIDGRITIRFQPTENLRNDIVLTSLREHENGVATKLLYGNVNGSIGRTPIVTTLAALAGRDSHTVSMSSAPGANGRDTDADTRTAIDTATWEIAPNLTLKNIIGVRNTTSHIYSDLDGTTANAYASTDSVDVDQFSEEIQLQGRAFDDSLSYSTGIYYFREAGLADTYTSTLGTTRDSHGHVRNISKSIYAQATYKVPFIPQLSLTGGIRSTSDTRNLSVQSYGNGVCRQLDLNKVQPPNCQFKFGIRSKEPTWTLSADYKVTDDTLVYVAHRRGYRAGANNLTSSDFLGYTPAGPEFVIDTELGLKTRWAWSGMTGSFNFAAYKSDYTDIQVAIKRLFDIGGGNIVTTTATTNAGAATIKGLELEFTVKPVTSLTIGGHYSYTDAHYTQYVNAGVDRSKDKFIGAAKNIAGFNVDWTALSSDRLGEFAIEFDGNYRSHVAIQGTNVNPVTGVEFYDYFVKGYTLFNARIEWRHVMNSSVDLNAFVKNLADHKYINSGVTLQSTTGTAAYTLGDPRTFGIGLHYTFD